MTKRVCRIVRIVFRLKGVDHVFLRRLIHCIGVNNMDDLSVLHCNLFHSYRTLFPFVNYILFWTDTQAFCEAAE
jgi:hypothetical protein